MGSVPRSIPVEDIDHESVAPFGWLLGKPDPSKPEPFGFRSPAGDFWHEHAFDPGKNGDTEVLWVKYRDNGRLVSKLEVHHLTQQAVVPLTNGIIQILCSSHADRSPDLSTLRAFRLSPGLGLCMRPGVWHATRADDATCLMLTRGSTTNDLVAHLVDARPANESTILEIQEVRLLVADADG